MKPNFAFKASVIAAAAMMTLGRMGAAGQEAEAKAAIPIRDLTPPPPKQTDGKHLLQTPRVVGTQSVFNVNPAEEMKWRFENWDANKDGKVTQQEFPERMRPGFGLADTNQDGSLTVLEIQSYLQGTAPPKGTGAVLAPRLPSLAFGVESVRNLAYAGTDNPRQKLDLYFPREPKSETPLPVIVFIHGGAWMEGDKREGAKQLKSFVQSGRYVGVSIGYRLSGEAKWPAQLHDCKAAIRWIKAHSKEYFMDPSKIGVWGVSAGGHLAALLGTTGDVKELEGDVGQNLDQNSRVVCVADYFGPANLLSISQQPSTVDRTKGGGDAEKQLLGGPMPDKEALAREASPVTHVSKGDATFFIAHGTKDPVVPFAQSQELHAALVQAKVPSVLQEVTNGGHGFAIMDLDQRVAAFFDQQLLGDKDLVIVSPIVLPVKSGD